MAMFQDRVSLAIDKINGYCFDNKLVGDVNRITQDFCNMLDNAFGSKRLVFAKDQMGGHAIDINAVDVELTGETKEISHICGLYPEYENITDKRDCELGRTSYRIISYTFSYLINERRVLHCFTALDVENAFVTLLNEQIIAAKLKNLSNLIGKDRENKNKTRGYKE